MKLDRLNQYTHHNDFLHQNYMNDFYTSHNRSSSCIDNLLNKNLAKYNSPSSPYSPCSCTHCLHPIPNALHPNHPGPKFVSSQRLPCDPAYLPSPHLSSPGQPPNILLQKLIVKRTIQSYFMSSQECCSFCRGRKGPYGLIQKNLNSKYLTGMDYYNVKVVNDIIYNDTTNLVSVFKDYLIYDDISEFMKRYYNNQESKTRLL